MDFACHVATYVSLWSSMVHKSAHNPHGVNVQEDGVGMVPGLTIGMGRFINCQVEPLFF